MAAGIRVHYEHMFDVLEGTVDQARERRRTARGREFAEMRADEARKEQRKAQLVRMLTPTEYEDRYFQTHDAA
jgi:hypothetical protein